MNLNEQSFVVLEIISSILFILDNILIVVYFIYQLDEWKNHITKNNKYKYLFYMLTTLLAAIPWFNWVYFYEYFNITILIFRFVKVV